MMLPLGPDAPAHVERVSASIDAAAAGETRPIDEASAASSRSWVAVFAHNEASRIAPALTSLLDAGGGAPTEVIVLANGCTDATAAAVRACAHLPMRLTLVDIERGDKANAWNLFVHDLLPVLGQRSRDICYFMDGDVTAGRHALDRLAEALARAPSARAAGALPVTGRDRVAWSHRMTTSGMLAGNLYALRGAFVDEVRTRGIRMPVGLIGEDFLLSWLVASDLGRRRHTALDEGALMVFAPDAGFAFRSLSPRRPGDYRIYGRRKWRYALRALQHEMLVRLLTERGLAAMPRTIDELYATAPLPSRLVWTGLDSPLRFAALETIRRRRRIAARASPSST